MSFNLTVAEINILAQKANDRKDGIYSFRGHVWVVKNRRFIAYANKIGECYQRMGAFNLSIGKVERHERVDKLKEWLKSQ